MIYFPFERTLYTNERFSPDGPWEFLPPPPGVFGLPSLGNRSDLFPLFRPRLPLASWQFTTVAENESFIGRQVRRVRATRRAAIRVIGAIALAGCASAARVGVDPHRRA